MQLWEKGADEALTWCGNTSAGGNGRRPVNILSCGGAAPYILFGRGRAPAHGGGEGRFRLPAPWTQNFTHHLLTKL